MVKFIDLIMFNDNNEVLSILQQTILSDGTNN